MSISRCPRGGKGNPIFVCRYFWSLKLHHAQPARGVEEMQLAYFSFPRLSWFWWGSCTYSVFVEMKPIVEGGKINKWLWPFFVELSNLLKQLKTHRAADSMRFLKEVVERRSGQRRKCAGSADGLANRKHFRRRKRASLEHIDPCYTFLY